MGTPTGKSICSSKKLIVLFSASKIWSSDSGFGNLQYPDLTQALINLDYRFKTAKSQLEVPVVLDKITENMFAVGNKHVPGRDNIGPHIGIGMDFAEGRHNESVKRIISTLMTTTSKDEHLSNQFYLEFSILHKNSHAKQEKLIYNKYNVHYTDYIQTQIQKELESKGIKNNQCISPEALKTFQISD